MPYIEPRPKTPKGRARRTPERSLERGATPEDDQTLVERVHAFALSVSATEEQAWRATVGAYLQKHPDVSLAMAERVVTCLIRPIKPAVRSRIAE
ncbi:hypothetical protein F1188_10525 [Roseospira marina]|uniref:Uncharacterized protein n=1 Tax=Roseospira marina TaxID=140057 RepID=A0A5M6IDG9_9PROT|nr:hypothetical protein [Roseospira marina]KAA5605658.1 hypothetical protein F1188_10525 [Roseospira marina]MBB4313266.1 hypothetical protein [Roseospira marina]MBB5085993.1 hypothetical protein [Roseospira marina]